MHTIVHPSGGDDTQAVMRALAHEGSVAELISGCTYTFGYFAPPHGSTLLGFGGTNYTDPQDYNGPRVRAAPGCEAVFDCSAAPRSVTMIGFMIDGVDGVAHGISGGSAHLSLERMYIAHCCIGIGGTVYDGSAYTNILIADRCKIVNCTRYGVDSPIDSELAHCICASNAVNVHALPGSNANRINGGRYEWPTSGENFRLDGGGENDGPVSDWIFDGAMQMDRAATCSVAMRHCQRIQFGVIASGRPGRAGATEPARSAHIYCEDSRDITATGMQMWAGANDDGSGVYSPVHAYQFKGVNRNVILCGGSVADGYTGDRAIDYMDGNTPDSMPGHRIACVGGLANFHH